MTNKILYIDDEPMEVKALIDQLKGNPIVFWAQHIGQARQILNCKMYQFDCVIADINGTSLDFVKDINELKHNKIIITSGVLEANVQPYEFVLKKELVKKIKALYHSL